MMTLLPPDPRRRLGSLLTLALLLVLATGLSLSHTRQLAVHVVQVDQVLLPALPGVHALTAAVDEVRGMSALHLLLRDAGALAELEARLANRRQQIEQRLAVAGRRPADETERALQRQVQARLATFWAAQDRLLAASRHAADDPQAAGLARTLLAGESQQAFLQLRAELEAWWSYSEKAAVQAAARAASQARSLAVLAVLEAAGALLLLAAALWRWVAAARRRRAAFAVSGLGGLASQARLLALDAAVVAARGGPGQAPAAQAQQVRELAAQLGQTAAEIEALIAAAPRGLE
jgi:hypothetical protein